MKNEEKMAKYQKRAEQITFELKSWSKDQDGSYRVTAHEIKNLLERLLKCCDQPERYGLGIEYLDDLFEEYERIRGKQKEKKISFTLPIAKIKKNPVDSEKTNSAEETEASEINMEKAPEPDLETLLLLMKKQIREEQEKYLELRKQISREQKICDYWRQKNRIYEDRIGPLVEPFVNIMKILCYFAGCTNSGCFPDMKGILQKKHQNLCTDLMPEMWGRIINGENLNVLPAMPKGVQEIHFEKDTEPELTETETANPAELLKDYKRKNQETREKMVMMQKQSIKLENNFKSGLLIWEYAYLLKSFLPVIEKLAACTEIDENTAVWAGSELNRIVEGYKCQNEEMRFLWVFPDSVICNESESVRIDFIAAEADCPGLYFELKSQREEKTLVCVTPGHVKVKR